MSKQYMTIEFVGAIVTIKTNSEKAIKNALGKVYKSNGTVKSFKIVGNRIVFEATTQKEKFGYWKPTYTYTAIILENTFEVEAPAAEVVEAPAAEVVEAPAAEVVTEEHTVTMTLEEKRAAWKIFIKEWAKGHADTIHAIRAAEAKVVNA